MEKESTGAVASGSGFRLTCDAGHAGRFRAATDSVLVTVSQRIRHLDTQGMWNSVVVEGKAEQDGTLVVRVLVSIPIGMNGFRSLVSVPVPMTWTL